MPFLCAFSRTEYIANEQTSKWATSKQAAKEQTSVKSEEEEEEAELEVKVMTMKEAEVKAEEEADSELMNEQANH